MPEVRVTEDSVSAIFLTDTGYGIAITLTDEELAFVQQAEEMHSKATDILDKAQVAAIADPNSTHAKECAAAAAWRAAQPPDPNAHEGMVVTITRAQIMQSDFLPGGLIGAMGAHVRYHEGRKLSRYEDAETQETDTKPEQQQ